MSIESNRTKSKRQTQRPSTVVFRLSLALIGIVALLLVTYACGKTAWDLLDLLIVPAVLVVGAYWLNKAERRSEQQIAENRLQEESLQTYLNYMTELMLERGLCSTEVESNTAIPSVRTIARARTLTVLRRLNGQQKGLLIRFLYQSKLINKGGPIVDLSGADLSNIDLSGNDVGGNRDRTFISYLSLVDIQLFGANLTGANLSQSKLSGANLLMADLSYANLAEAHLMFADLRFATLTGANLQNANLIGAILSGATGATEAQLAQASSLQGATLPDGQVHNPPSQD